MAEEEKGSGEAMEAMEAAEGLLQGEENGDAENDAEAKEEAEDDAAEGDEDNAFRTQLELVEFVNKKREDEGFKFLTHDPALSRAAQAHAEELLQQRWEPGAEFQGKGPHRRYFEAGSSACVAERVSVFPASAGKEYDSNNARRALARTREKLLQKDSAIKDALKGSYTHAGFGAAVCEDVLYVVAALSHQLGELHEMEGVDLQSKQLVHGTISKPKEKKEPKWAPVGCTVHFYPEDAEASIPATYLAPAQRQRRGKAKALADADGESKEGESKDGEDTVASARSAASRAAPGPSDGYSGQGSGELVSVVYPWQIDFEPSDRSFCFELDLPTQLQRRGLYEVPRGVFHIRVYAQDPALGDVPGSEQAGYSLPDPAKHVCVCSASFSHPPLPGTKSFAVEREVARDRKRRLVTLPIEQVQVLAPRQLVPDGFEVYVPRGGTQGRSKLPLMCYKKSESEAELAAASEEGSAKFVVELAVAFGEDDVPPGFEIVRSVKENRVVNMRTFLPRDDDDHASFKSRGRGTPAKSEQAGDEKAEDEDNGDENAEGVGDDGDEEPIFLCVRLSDDPVETSTRGITDIFLQLDADEGSHAAYEKLDIVPGTMHAMFRVVGSGAEELEEEELEAVPTGEGLAGEDSDDEEEDDEEALDGANRDEWGELEGKDLDHIGRLDPDSLEGGDLGECILPTAESKRAELEEAERAAQVSRIEGLIENARAEREKLISENLGLQKGLVPFLTKKQMQRQLQLQKLQAEGKAGDEEVGFPGEEPENAASQDQAGIQEKERQYVNSLNACNDAQDTLRRTRDAYDKVAMDLQTRLDDKEAKATEIRNSFAHFKREIAKAAENSRTGKPIPMRIIKQFEETEQQKDSDVEKVRLKNINLRAQLRKLENALHEKEKLAEGLHLIDFEQLKIENQTLNEKIEERNEELHKLRKKTTTTVQVLTHIKEKLQYVQAEVVQLKAELGELDKEVTASRDQLTKSKHARDALRCNNEARKRDQGFVNSSLLVNDFQQRKLEIKALKRKIRDLQQKYSNLTGVNLDAITSKAAARSPTAAQGASRHE